MPRKDYYALHREKCLQQQKDYKARNREKVLARERAAYQANRETRRVKDAVQRVKHRERIRAYQLARPYDPAAYLRNRTAILAQRKRYYDQNRAKIRAKDNVRARKYKELLRAFADAEAAGGCVDCGIKTQVVLDFDHVRGKKVMPISQIIRSGYPVRKLLAEIDKCEVRCSNCHRIVTAQRRKVAA